MKKGCFGCFHGSFEKLSLWIFKTNIVFVCIWALELKLYNTIKLPQRFMMRSSGSINAMATASGEVFYRFTCIFPPLPLLFSLPNPHPATPPTFFCIHSPPCSLPDRRTAAIPTANEGQRFYYLHVRARVRLLKKKGEAEGASVGLCVRMCVGLFGKVWG